MILNKHGAFQTNKVRILPFRHHLNRSLWRVFVWDPKVAKETVFAVFAADNAQAAEIGYTTHLAYALERQEALDTARIKKQQSKANKQIKGEQNE